MRTKFGVLQQTHGVRLHTKFRLDRFILSPSVGENPQFLLFFGLRHLTVRSFIYPALLQPPDGLFFGDQFGFRPTGSTAAALIALIHSVDNVVI